MAVKRCTVTITDGDGMSHSAECEGETLYQAASAGLRVLQRCDFVPATSLGRRLEVRLHDSGVKHWLPLHKVEQWMYRQVRPKDFEEKRTIAALTASLPKNDTRR